MALSRHGARLLPCASALGRGVGVRAPPPLLPPWHALRCAPRTLPQHASRVRARVTAHFTLALTPDAAPQPYAAWGGGHPSPWRASPPSLPSRVQQAVERNPDGVLAALIAANCGVYALWQTQPKSMMRRHFMVSPYDALQPRRCYTLVTAAFSHFDGWHLAGNMLPLFFFGREIGRLFGGSRLLALYLVGGAASSAAHVLWARHAWRKQHGALGAAWGVPRGLTPALGASGAVNAVVLFDTLLFPTRIIYVNFILPMPAILLGGIVLLRDALGVYNAGGGFGHDGVAHAGHVGGAAVGAVAWAALRLRARRGGW